MTLSPALTELLTSLDLDPHSIEALARQTIEEDLDGGVDVTSVATIPDSQQSIAEFHARKSGYIAGLCVAAVVLEIVNVKDYTLHVKDGSRIEEGQLILSAHGNTRNLLLAER